MNGSRSDSRGGARGGTKGGRARGASLDEATPASLVKEPEDWTTGDEPATGAQLSYLKTLSRDAGEDFDDEERLTKSEASKRIDELRERSPRVNDAD